MKNIPSIKFSNPNNSSIEGFDFLNFTCLFERLPNKTLDHNPFKPHRLHFFALILITDGEVNHMVDFEMCTLKKNDALIISKGQIHAFDEVNKYEGFMVLFTEGFLQRNTSQQCIAHINSLYNYFTGKNVFHEKVDVAVFLSFLMEELENKTKFQSSIVGSLLAVFLLKLAINKHEEIESDIDRNMEYFNDFRKLLETNYTKTRDASYYADKLNISYKHLNNVCKLIVKKTAKMFIDDYVTLEAKRLLASTTLSSKEISFAIGFDEPTNFQKYFKKQTNLLPLEFRKNLG